MLRQTRLCATELLKCKRISLPATKISSAHHKSCYQLINKRWYDDCLYSSKSTQRLFHTSNTNNNEERRIETKILSVKNPFRYFALKMKLFLLKSYFDQEFSEDDFISGAKQAISFVSTKISEGKINDLDDVLTSEGIQSSRDIYNDFHRNISTVRVDPEDVMNISMSDIGFDYGDNGTKFANVLIVCFCVGKEGVSRKFGNIDVVTMPTRVLKYSFRREYTPGVTSDWLVDYMEYIPPPQY